MGSIAVTGANGFLGWHTRCAIAESNLSAVEVPLGDRFDHNAAAASIDGASRLVHIAGVNRGTDADVEHGNIQFAHQVADSLARASTPPPVVVYANSTQSGNGSVYGESKATASDILRKAADAAGSEFQDIALPNIFGEHGRPFYNAVTSTFSHLLSIGETPAVAQDRELTLLHAQHAADVLLGKVDRRGQSEFETRLTVSELLAQLSSIADLYSHGEIPDVSSTFGRDLFNTYRSYTFPSHAPTHLSRKADPRGSFFEVVRSLGGSAQTSFSTSNPGVSRGDHFHRRKIERFTVLAGSATISLRKMFTDEIYEFEVTGDDPVAVDMPTMWSHKITNTGTGLLYTCFWANDIFDPDAPDTIAEEVFK